MSGTKRPLSRPAAARAASARERRAASKASSAAAARAHTAAVRKQLGRLRDRVVTARTLKRYKRHVAQFYEWCRLHGIQLALRTDDFDMQVSAWAECLWSEGDPKSVFGNGLCGLQHLVPGLRGRLHGSWRLHATWGRCEPAAQVPPLTRTMVQGIAGFFCRKGWKDIAIMILTAFHCILRTAEMLKLLVGDCVIGKDTIVLTLRDTKIGVRTGIHQTVDIDDPWLVACFSAMVQDKQRGQRLVSCDPATFRKRWKQALKALRIPAVYNPYGLRRGGATSLFLHTGSFDRVMEKGRWRSLHAMRQYLDLSMEKLAADTEHSAFEHVCFQEARQLHSLAM